MSMPATCVVLNTLVLMRIIVVVSPAPASVNRRMTTLCESANAAKQHWSRLRRPTSRGSGRCDRTCRHPGRCWLAVPSLKHAEAQTNCRANSRGLGAARGPPVHSASHSPPIITPAPPAP